MSCSCAHISGYLAAAAAAAPDRLIFLCGDREISACEAMTRVAALSSGLITQLELEPGERVAIASLATDRSMEALLATSAAGGVATPLNWRWQTDEAAYAVDLVGASIIIADADCMILALRLAGRCASLRAVVLLGQQQEYASAQAKAAFERFNLTAAGAGEALPVLVYAESLMADLPSEVHQSVASSSNRSSSSRSGGSTGPLPLRAPADGAALIVFTSGSTGRPKGVVLSHSALHAQCMAKLLLCYYSSADIYLHAAPLFHIGGLNSALAMLAAGAKHIFLPRFDPAAALLLMLRHGVTSFIAVPAMVADLAAAAAVARLPPLCCVRRLLLGGGSTSPALLAAMAELFPAAEVQSAYGMTEAASSISFSVVRTPGSKASGSSGADADAVTLDVPRADDAAAAAAGVYVGRPPPGIELAVYQTDGVEERINDGSKDASSCGRITQHGCGEVLTRGPHVLLRYWGDPEATAAVHLPGGWMRTGDLGYLCRGSLWLLGRAKDMIKSGGENVHAWEVERALVDHPAVAAAAVVGVPHWRLGEAVAAAVVLAPAWTWVGRPCQSLLPVPPAAGSTGLGLPAAANLQAAAQCGGRGGVRSIDACALQQHCRDAGLAGFKLPRVFLLCEPAGAAPRGNDGSVALHTLPVTSTGKPAKHTLRALLAAEVAALEKGQAEQQVVVQHQPRARL